MEKKLFDHFHAIECCNYCCLRMTGETSSNKYINMQDTITERGYVEEKEESASKVMKNNPCVACLGLLEIKFCESVIDEIIKMVKKNKYYTDSFNLALNFPVMIQLRSHALWVELIEAFPNDWRRMFPFGMVSITVKDVLKWLLAPRIEVATKFKFNSKSDFLITISVSHEDNDSECKVLNTLIPEKFAGKGQNVTRKRVDKALETIAPEDFRMSVTIPPPVPTQPAVVSSIDLCHASVFVAGRYRKLSRTLPQTPWLLNGQRKMESSVQEYITKPLEKAFSASGSKFVASGREDVDVRMLGSGRPFIVELFSPSRPQGNACTENEEDSWQEMVTQSITEASGGDVSITSLSHVSKAQAWKIREGEATKRKTYSAVIEVRNRKGDLPPSTILTLTQATPIRVLHRRPLADRQRSVNINSLKPLAKPSSAPEGVEYMLLDVTTDAGTYVKELVHGDLGRTTPCLADILLADSADILALDVTDIDLEWPPASDEKR